MSPEFEQFVMHVVSGFLLGAALASILVVLFLVWEWYKGWLMEKRIEADLQKYKEQHERFLESYKESLNLTFEQYRRDQTTINCKVGPDL